MISDRILKKCPLKGDAFKSAKPYSSKWNEIGRALDVYTDFRESLRCGDYKHRSDEDRLELVLNEWLKMDSSQTTWEFLMSALHTEVSNEAVIGVLKYLHQPKIIQKYDSTVDIENQPPSVDNTGIDEGILSGDDDLYAVLYWTYDIADSSKFRQKLNVSSPDPSKTDIIGIVDDWLRTGNVSWKGLSQALIHLGKREEALGIAACHPGTRKNLHTTSKVKSRQVLGQKTSQVEDEGSTTRVGEQEMWPSGSSEASQSSDDTIEYSWDESSNERYATRSGVNGSTSSSSYSDEKEEHSSSEVDDTLSCEGEESMEDENVQENKSAKRKCNSSHEEIYMPQTKRRASNRKDSQELRLSQPGLEPKMVKPYDPPYFPKEGDTVVYFLQGHDAYCQEVKKKKPYHWKTQQMPWDKYHLGPQEFCHVKDVHFIGKEPSLCIVTLALLDSRSTQQSGSISSPYVFTLQYHEMDGVLDFLIPKSVYTDSVKKQWNPGDRFTSYFENSYWTGTILSRKPYHEKYPFSDWRCFEVQWENGDPEDQLSPWEMEPLLEKEVEKREGDNSWLARANSLLDQLISSDMSDPFIDPVDVEEYPSYSQFVKCPMDLTTIRNKLSGKAYSAPGDFISDVRLVFSNAKRFNEPQSQIYKLTCELETYFEQKLYTKMKQLPQSRVSVAEKEVDEMSDNEEKEDEMTNDEEEEDEMTNDEEEEDEMTNDEEEEDDDYNDEEDEETEEDTEDTDEGSSGYKKDILLKKSPESKDVVDLLRKKAFKWEDLALELHVPESAREEIRDTRKSNVLKLEATIQVWIEQERPPVTWGHLIEVLRDKMEMIDYAKSVEEYLRTSEAWEKYHSAKDWKPYK